MNGRGTYRWLCETFDLIRDDIAGGRADDGDLDQALGLVAPFRWDTREEVQEMAVAIDAMVSKEKRSRVETRLAAALEDVAGISRESSADVAAGIDAELDLARAEATARRRGLLAWIRSRLLWIKDSIG